MKRELFRPAKSRWALVCLLALLAICLVPAAYAYPTGLSGYSGKTAGRTCNSCHDGGVVPTVVLTGPTSVVSGSTNKYTLTISGGQQVEGGLDVAVTAGTIAASDPLTQIMASELTHNQPKSADASGNVAWTFNWTAPTVTANTSVTMYGAGLSADASGDTSGDSGSTATLAIAVTAAAPAPTITATPSSLSFAYTIGGTSPASKSLAISSSGTAVSYTIASSAAWLTASAASGTTPGTLNITANPTGLAAGSYTGNITVTSTGASNSPQTVPVTFVVSPAVVPNPQLTATPSSLAFAYQSGSGTLGSQTIAVTSSGSAISYTAAASGGTWLSVTPASGTTPGNLAVSVNPGTLAAGTYNGTITITSAGASNSPQTVPVTLVVTAAPPPTTGTLTATPATLSFTSSRGDDHSSTNPAPQTVNVSSSATKPVAFTTDVAGMWLHVTPAGGTTPAALTVSVDASGMASGTYTGTIKVNATGMDSAAITVTLVVGSGEDGNKQMSAQPFISDTGRTGSVTAKWVRGAGVPVSNSVDQYKTGLLLIKNSASTSKALAGATITGVSEISITELGFDVAEGGHCTAKSPHFVITTSDDVVHNIAGCSLGTVQAAPALGWKRLRFNIANPAQAFPPVNPTSTVKSIRVVLDEGPDATINKSGVVVLDNIDINGTLIGKGNTTSHDE